jgi:hypothetical protein
VTPAETTALRRKNSKAEPLSAFSTVAPAATEISFWITAIAFPLLFARYTINFDPRHEVRVDVTFFVQTLEAFDSRVVFIVLALARLAFPGRARQLRL